MVMIKGIDISHYAGNVNFDILSKNKDINFIILKLGNTLDKPPYFTIDENFLDYYNDCKFYNIPVGGYVYSYTNKVRNMELAMAQMFEIIYKYNLEFVLPIYLDLEAEELKEESRENMLNLIETFCNPIEENGFWAGIYSSLDWYKNVLDGKNLKNRYTYWIAHYGNYALDKYENIFDMWQYEGDCKLNGIEGLCDKNIMYRNLIFEINNSRKNKIEYYSPIFSESIVDALKFIGEDSSFENRKKIAIINNIKNYIGSYMQNTEMLELLKKGKLRKR